MQWAELWVGRLQAWVSWTTYRGFFFFLATSRESKKTQDRQGEIPA